MNRKQKQVSLEPYGYRLVRPAPVKSLAVETRAVEPAEVAPPSDVHETAGIPQPTPKSGNNAGCIAGFIILVVGVLVLGSLMTTPSGTNGASYSASNHDAGMACIMAEKLIKPQLKAPKSAEFDYADCKANATRAGNVWTLQSYVDGDNSFGAHIRSYYVAQLSNNPPSDTWRLVELEFID